MIECRHLTKRFGDYTAVDDISLSVAPGELFGYLGPNGAGKTTAIKMMIGLLRPTSGSCAIGGYDVQAAPLDARRILGYIPDNPFLYEKLTGREYLAFMADLYGVVHRDRTARITELLELFALQDKGRDLIGGYSRGMRQKIALAGALIHAPKVIFLDEPTVGLDPAGARTMRDILRELCNRGTTVFISTHILEIAERLCDRVAIVNRGRMIALGTVEELRQRTRAERLAAYANSEADFAPLTHAGGPTGWNQIEGEVANGSSPQSLEEIFLQLTDGNHPPDVSRYLE